jgi:hypothetical protein
MQQKALSSTGGNGSSEIPRILTAGPGTLRLRIMLKNGLKVESTCLLLGGMINAHGPETTFVEFVGPEPGVGYGWSRKIRGPDAIENWSGKIARSAICRGGESGGILCS